jgi:hypothetical protein
MWHKDNNISKYLVLKFTFSLPLSVWIYWIVLLLPQLHCCGLQVTFCSLQYSYLNLERVWMRLKSSPDWATRWFFSQVWWSCRWGETISLNFGHQWTYCSSPRWYISMENQRGMISTGVYLERKLIEALICHHKYHMDWPGRELGSERWVAG